MASFSLLPSLFLSLAFLFHVTHSLTPEGQALLLFKTSLSLSSYPSPAMADWLPSSPSPCSWTGITCKNLSVISLNLPSSNLSGPFGPLSPSLSSLSSLRHLNLRCNDLSGPLSSILLPPQLQSLVLSSNSLSGSFSESLLSLHRLRSLNLAGNRLSGRLPAGLAAAFPELESLNLSRNAFSGEIPGEIAGLRRLVGILDLSRNAFSGPVPASLGGLPETVFIDLSFNSLSGAVPASLVGRGAALYGNAGLVVGPPAVNSLSGGAIAAVVAGDVIAVALMGVLFMICYRRAVGGARRGSGGGPKDEKRQPRLEFVGRRCHEFDLEGLLKASALVLGKSELGILYKVVFDDGRAVAVRRLGEGGSQRFGEFKAEVAAIAELCHPNVVPIRAYFWSTEEKLLVYDYVPGGNLADVVHGGRRLRWTTRLGILRGLAEGLAFLHESSPRRFVHGDLKPSNVLLGPNYEPLIADFGLRRLADISSPAETSPPPPARDGRRPVPEKRPLVRNWQSAEALDCHYRAPEGGRPSQKWDVYSFGVIVLEMITGRSPESTLTSAGIGLVQWVQDCIEEERPLGELLDPCLLAEEHRDEEEEEREEREIVGALKIVLSCVQNRPERRPSMRHVVDSLKHL